MKHLSFFLLVTFISALCFAQNVGIGIPVPLTKLDVNGQLTIRGGTPGINKVLASDATGTATWQNSSINTGFFVYRNTFQTITTGVSTVLDFFAVYTDAGSNYNTTSDYFNCPTDGFYHFDFNVLFYTANAFSGDKTLSFGLYKNGGQFWEMSDNITYLANSTNHGFGMNFYLSANDKITIHVSQNTGLSQAAIGSFSGYRVY